MADVKLAWSSWTTLTITNLNSRGTSATTAWQSAVIDNSSTKYLNIQVVATFAAVNTAPANSKAWFFWVANLADTSGSEYDSTGSDVPGGAEGTITIPDFTSLALPLYHLGRIAYPVQNKVLTKTFTLYENIGFVPEKFSLIVANHTGYTAAASGNSVKWRGQYETIA
jgi:hypothetical protein